jgi:hypothetical protein
MLILTSFGAINAYSPVSSDGFDNSMLNSSTDDSYEDNDDINNATTLRAGNYSTLIYTDDDWYRISLKSGQDLTINIWFNNSEGDLELALYSSFGLLDESQGTGDHEVVSYSGVNTTGYYYIRVYCNLNSINNYTMDISTDDITGPNIKSRLLVTHNSPTSVNISWVSDEPCTSILKYSTYTFGRVIGQLSNMSYSYNHLFTLTNLTPLTVYNYWITLTDRKNNSQETGPYIFKTTQANDTSDPTLEIIVPNVIIGMVLVNVSASDDTGIEKVEFYLNDSYKFTDYSNNFQWRFDSIEYNNGLYTIGAKAFDRSGRFSYNYKNVTIANPLPDTTPPKVKVITHSNGSKVKGANVTVSVEAWDMDTGINSVEFFVDGKHVWTEIVEGVAGVHERVSYQWNTYGDSRARLNNLTVRATNNDRVSSSDSIGVYSENPTVLLPYSKDFFAIKPFEVTRGQVRRAGTYYEVILYVKNLCSKTLYSVAIEDYHKGFQPISSESGYQQKAYYLHSTKTSYIKFKFDNLSPGEMRTLKYNMVPIAFAPDPRFDYEIGSVTHISYKESYGVKIPTSHLDYYVPSVEIMDGWYSTNSIPITSENVISPMSTRDYLVVTHPRNLFVRYSVFEVNELLSKLAEFSRHKNAVLGYLSSTSQPCEELLDAINPQLEFEITANGALYQLTVATGGWSNLLTSDWSYNGYLLLVGEIGIIPSFLSLGWDVKWGSGDETPFIKYTDLPYADRTGDGLPDLKVGRMIGSECSTLIQQVDTSLGAYLDKQGYGFDKSHAMLASGTGGSYKAFIQNVEEMEDILISTNQLVTKVHGSEYIPIKDFNFNFKVYDQIGVGDIYDGIYGEIVVGSWEQDTVYIYKSDGSLLKSFIYNLDWRDRILVGDVMGDYRDEICIVDHYYGTIDIYQGYKYQGGYGSSKPSTNTPKQKPTTRAPPTGSRMIRKVASFDSDYSYLDEVSIGNVWGDNKLEIVLADESANKIKIYDYSGNLVNSFDCTINFYDGLAVGNAHSNSYEEIVIGESLTDKITIRSNTGTILDSFDFSFGYGDFMTIGDFYKETREEIIIGKGSDRYVYYCYYKSNEWKISKTPIEIPYRIFDGLAIGNIVDDGRHEIIIGNDFENKIQYFDVHWGHRLSNAFETNCQNKDIIHYSGHGNINAFSSFVSSPKHFPLYFGDTNPVVIAPSCLCGDYVNGRIAEAFLDSGAGAFIGSTEISRIPENLAAGKLLYGTYWNQKHIDIGTAFTNLCRDQYPLNFNWRFWVTENNLYGDPKFGTAEDSLGIYDYIPLPKQLFTMALDDYKVNSYDGFDYVEIPGGRAIMETDMYQVPAYVESILVPSGFMVQDVQLKDRANLGTSRELNIPITRNDISAPNGYNPSQITPVIDRSGWYPTEAFKWQVTKNGNGSSNLVITVYPFQYNPKTTEVKYYKNFVFDIDYIPTTVELEEILLNEEYDYNETVEAEITLKNTENSNIQVLMSGEILSYLTENIIDCTQIQALSLRRGSTATSVKFDTSDLPIGQYTLKIEIEDTNGSLLDSATARFKVGISEVQVTDIYAEPEIFKIGHNVKINMTYKNTGSVDLFVEMNMTIRDEVGNVVQVFSQNNSGLTTSSSDVFEVIWSTVGINSGKYYITGYLLYDNKLTVSSTIEVKDIAAGLREVIEYMKSLELPKGIENSLITKLENAAKAIERGQIKSGLMILNAFYNELDALKGKQITSAHTVIIRYKLETIMVNIGE